MPGNGRRWLALGRHGPNERLLVVNSSQHALAAINATMDIASGDGGLAADQAKYPWD